MITAGPFLDTAIPIAPSSDTSGVSDRTAIDDAITDLGATGGTIQLLPGVYHVDKLDGLAATTGIWLRGAGKNATTLTFTSAGGIADLTGTSFFTCSDMLITPSIQRTAEYFHLDAGSGSCEQNSFLRLRAASPYKLVSMNACTGTLLDDIEFLDHNSGWTVNAGISLDGAATSTVCRNISGGTAAGVTNALIYLNGTGIDTFQGSDWNLIGLSGTNMTGLVINAGEWIRLNNISIEAGTGAYAISTSTTGVAKGVTITGLHALGLVGVFIRGGKSWQIQGGEIVQCQNAGIQVSAYNTVQDITLANLNVSDTGLATTNTYPAIYFQGGGINYFHVHDCTPGNNRLLASTNRNSYGIQVDATCDYYTLVNNQCEGSTGGVLDNGGGTHKTVTGNI